MLNNFDDKYIGVKDENNTTPATDTITDQLTKTYNELLDKVKESNVEFKYELLLLRVSVFSSVKS